MTKNGYCRVCHFRLENSKIYVPTIKFSDGNDIIEHAAACRWSFANCIRKQYFANKSHAIYHNFTFLLL